MAEVNASALAAVKRFLETLMAHNIHVQSAYLFGSYAKDAENKWSDIDVAIVSSDFSEDRFEEGVRLMKRPSLLCFSENRSIFVKAILVYLALKGSRA